MNKSNMDGSQGIRFIYLNPYLGDNAALIWSSALSNKHCQKIQKMAKSTPKMSKNVTHDIRHATDDR